MDNRALKQEIKRLQGLLDRAEVPRQKQEAIEAVIDNIAWLRLKLDETRAEMMGESIISEYDNGGNQKGTHANPIFKAYTDLWKAYTAGLKVYLEYIPKDLQDEVTQSEDVLSKVIKMKRG